MGFIYSSKGLCCDFCGGEGARKMKCPYGWCQALATCAACRELKRHKLAYESHANCKINSERIRKRDAAFMAGGLHLELYVAGTHDYDRGDNKPGDVYYRCKDSELGSAASKLVS